MRKIRIASLILCLCMLLSGCGELFSSQPDIDYNNTITMLNVGQAACTLIESDGKFCLIDAGNAAFENLEHLGGGITEGSFGIPCNGDLQVNGGVAAAHGQGAIGSSVAAVAVVAVAAVVAIAVIAIAAEAAEAKAEGPVAVAVVAVVGGLFEFALHIDLQPEV